MAATTTKNPDKSNRQPITLKQSPSELAIETQKIMDAQV